MRHRDSQKKKHTGALIVLIVVITALAAVVVLNPFETLLAKIQPAAAPEEGPVRVSVRVATLESSSIDQMIEGNGNVIDPSSLDVYPEVAGTLTELSVSVGDQVEKDQIIALVDPSRAGMVYKKSTVTSPSAGTVLALPFVEGATVSAQAPIVRLGLIDDLEVVMNIAEQHIGKVEIGTAAELTFAAYPSESFPAEVTYLSPVLNPASRSLEIRLTIDDPQRKIKSGMFPTVSLFIGHKDNIISIPTSAVVYEGTKAYAYTADGQDKANKVELSLGVQVSDRIEVTEGLAAGDRLIIEGQALLTDGTDLNIVQ